MTSYSVCNLVRVYKFAGGIYFRIKRKRELSYCGLAIQWTKEHLSCGIFLRQPIFWNGLSVDILFHRRSVGEWEMWPLQSSVLVLICSK